MSTVRPTTAPSTPSAVRAAALELSPSTSLYERLGGRRGIEAITEQVIANHLSNPLVAPRFANADLATLKRHACDFFCAGSGGPERYTGREMVEAHTGMNISEQEFVAVLDDILAALDAHDVDPQSRQEVLGILYGLKADIVRL